ISIRSASSVRVIRRTWSSSSSLTAIAMSHRAFEVFAHQRALGEDAGEDERQYDRKPATGRKAGVEMKRMFRGGDGLADRSDDQAEKLQSQQRPGYRMETVG